MKNLNSIVNKRMKPPKKFFDWCFSHIPNFKWENKKETIIASDRADCPLVTRRLTKNSRLSFGTKFYSFAIILVSKKRIEIQSYAFWSNVTDGKQTIESRLVNFEQFSNGKHIKAHEWGGNKWYEGLLRNYGYMSGPYTNTKFFQNNWQDKVRKISELKYLEIEHLDRESLANMYKFRLEIEFLQKINAKTLAKEIQYPDYVSANRKYVKSVDMRTVTMSWLRKNKWRIKNTNATFNKLMIEDLVRKRNGKLVEGIENYLNYREVSEIPEGIGLIRFQKWLVKNQKKFSYYLDYLDLLRDLNIPLKGEIILMPRDLRKAHDDLVEVLSILRAKQREIEHQKRLEELKQQEEEYQKRVKKLKKLEREFGDYAIIAPKKLEDLVDEGTKLSHCVYTSHYIKAQKQGDTTIMFVRKKEALDEPFCTLEYRNGQLVQLMGKRNVPPEDDVVAAVDKWTKFAKFA